MTAELIHNEHGTYAEKSKDFPVEFPVRNNAAYLRLVAIKPGSNEIGRTYVSRVRVVVYVS